MCYSVVKSQSINGRGLVTDLLSLPVAVPGISKIIPCHILKYLPYRTIKKNIKVLSHVYLSKVDGVLSYLA